MKRYIYGMQRYIYEMIPYIYQMQRYIYEMIPYIYQMQRFANRMKFFPNIFRLRKRGRDDAGIPAFRLFVGAGGGC